MCAQISCGAPLWDSTDSSGAGVPQDWATHMVGHELTALYGLDHAKTLAVVLPGMLKIALERQTSKALAVWRTRVGHHSGR